MKAIETEDIIRTMESKSPAIEITEDAIITMPHGNVASVEEKTQGEREQLKQEFSAKPDDYPQGFKLVLITVSLILAVLLWRWIHQ